MAFVSLSKDYYTLEVINFAVSPYQKNGEMECGRNARDPANGYVSEVLVMPDLSPIPDFSTITSVEVLFNTTDNSVLNPGGSKMGVRLQDKGSWTDTPTTSPLYNTFSNAAWVSPIVAEGSDVFSSTPPGSQFIGSTSQMVQMFQDWINNTVNRDGFLLNYDAATFAYYFILDSVTVQVNYEPPVTRSRQVRVGVR